VYSRWLATIGIAVALAVTACSGGTSQTSSSSAASNTPAATSAPAQAATAPAHPTTAPTAAPTTAPTVAPTIAPTVAATPTTAPQPTTAPATPTTAAQASTSGGGGEIPPELKAMGVAWANAKSFRITMDTSSADAQSPGHITMEIVRPDRQHIKFAVGQQTFEMIDIGTDHYFNINGKWTKTTTKAPTASLADPQQVLDNVNKSLDSNTKVTKGGTETINGTHCQDWTVDTSGSNPTTATMCIGLQDNLPVQFKDPNGKFTMTFSDWNAPIDIKPPI